MVTNELDFNPPENKGDVSDIVVPFIDKALVAANDGLKYCTYFCHADFSAVPLNIERYDLLT